MTDLTLINLISTVNTTDNKVNLTVDIKLTG